MLRSLWAKCITRLKTVTRIRKTRDVASRTETVERQISVVEWPTETDSTQDDVPTTEAVERRISKWSIAVEHTQRDSPSIETIDVPRDDVPEAGIVERQKIKLPVKIEKYIIGFLDNHDYEDGLPTIARCARVCRAWLPFSRFKLYYIVELRRRSQWDSFERAMLPSSGVADYMPKVEVLDVREWDGNERQPWAYLVLFEGTTVLTGLRKVTLQSVDLRQWNSSGSPYRSLRKLILCSCTFTNTGQLDLFVAAFPALTHLTLEMLNLRSGTPPLSTPRGTIGRPLTHLDLRDYQISALALWLVDAHLIHTLTSLTIHRPIRPAAWKTLSRAFNGSSLQELDIEANDFDEGL